MARTQPAIRPVVGVAWLLVTVAACTEGYRSPRVLSDDPVVMGISLSVLEDGRYAADLAPLPADRPRAEVLPLDTVELDALVANVDGPRELDDAAWVLCGDGCLASLARQGERYGQLEDCTEDSAAHSFACLAGRGARPRVVMPAVVAEAIGPSYVSATLFLRVAVVVGSPGGPTTDECLQQLVQGPREELWGCGIGVRELLYGPGWTFHELLSELDIDYYGDDTQKLPGNLSELLPPNAAPVIEQVKVGTLDDFYAGEAPVELEPRSIHEVIEIEGEVVIEPVVSVRDQQLTLEPIGPDQWIGVPEKYFYNVWTDRDPRYGGFADGSYVARFSVGLPEEDGPMRLYVTVTDSRGAVSWFTLDLRVATR